jgi:hypothetical protein
VAWNELSPSFTEHDASHPISSLLVALHWLLAIFIIGALLGGYFVLTPMPNSDAATCDELTRSHLSLHDSAGNRRINWGLRVDFSRFLKIGDLVFSLLQETKPVVGCLECDFRGPHVVLGGSQIGLDLLPIFERNGLGFIEIVLPLLLGLCEPELWSVPSPARRLR